MNPIRAIQQVIVYSGHQATTELGPYAESVVKRVGMFKDLNAYREMSGRKPWKVSAVPGEKLVDTLRQVEMDKTLLVFPAGQSSRLEKVFSLAQVRFIKEEFFGKGGRAYFTCGASYWASRKRIYKEVCLDRPENPITMVKESAFSVFQGVSTGPLCPFPGVKYKVGFYSDAVQVESEEDTCTIYLSGGGSFMPDVESDQKVRVLAKYNREELLRVGVKEEEIPEREKAAVMVSMGSGAALMAMFHPYYSASDIDVALYEKVFEGCGTDWKKVHAKLSSTDARMRFVWSQMLIHLEDMEF